MDFKITSKYKPTGDQPQAIRQLTEGVLEGDPAQVLLGVTGSGKTFTVANVIANVGKPTLILSHNKTLAAQLYQEMKGFFPENAVEYYVSYYDYYQPEAYLPTTDTYIEKDLAINDEIDKLRLGAVSALLSGRKDVIVVSSVSCIYGMGGPVAMQENIIKIHRGQRLDRNEFLRKLVDALYVRNDIELQRGNFRVKGETVDIFMAYSDHVLRVTWWDDEIDSIEEVDSLTYHRLASFEDYEIYPANLFVTTKEQQESAIRRIQDDLVKQVEFFKSIGDGIKAQRIKERVEYDMEMIKELGHCSGIENYSRYFDGRHEGERPYCLLDFFPKDFLLVVDESHVSIPQIGAMYGGDRARKKNLVEYGFRLPAAFDNRPLKFEEFHDLIPQAIYDMMRKNSERILHLINQMMDLRKIDKGQMVMHMSETDMVAFIGDEYKLFCQQAIAKSIQFTFEHEDETLPVWIDRDNFDKVLMNVLSNAFKFTPAGGRIRITLSHSPHHVRIAIKDSGKGIQEEKLETIFQRFYQSATTSNDRNVGTGIGLDLTRSLVELHYGTITAAVIPLSGIAFRIFIGKNTSHGSHDRLADPVFRCNQLNVAYLTLLHKKRILTLSRHIENLHHISRLFPRSRSKNNST